MFAGLLKSLGQPLALLAGLLLLPQFLSNDYYVTVLILCSFNAMVVLGLNLLLGFAGQISLGHAAFFGLSAYASAVLSTTQHWPLEASIPAAILLTCLVALALGIPALKLTGHYLAMATLGFGVIVSIFFNEAIALTGGPSGFVGIPRLSLFGHGFWDDIEYYYLVSSVLALLYALSLNLLNSRTGRALRALHTSEKAASCLGVDVARHKLYVFVLSAAYAAVAGALYAHYLSFVAPSSFGFLYSVELIVMVVLGGAASLTGGIAGAFFLTVLPEVLRAFENIEVLIFGAILILFMIFAPGGLAGLLESALARLSRLRVPGRAGDTRAKEQA